MLEIQQAEKTKMKVVSFPMGSNFPYDTKWRDGTSRWPGDLPRHARDMPVHRVTMPLMFLNYNNLKGIVIALVTLKHKLASDIFQMLAAEIDKVTVLSWMKFFTRSSTATYEAYHKTNERSLRTSNGLSARFINPHAYFNGFSLYNSHINSYHSTWKQQYLVH